MNVGIKLFGDTLVVAHSGKPFDKRDIRGICGVSNGTKKDLKEKTGYKGIGFKSVFGQSEKVIVFSENEYFRFDSSFNFSWNTEWLESRADWEQKSERKFSCPWQIIPISSTLTKIDPSLLKKPDPPDAQLTDLFYRDEVAIFMFYIFLPD